MRKFFVSLLLVVTMMWTGCLLDQGVGVIEESIVEKHSISIPANLVSISSVSDLAKVTLEKNQEKFMYKDIGQKMMVAVGFLFMNQKVLLSLMEEWY